MPASVVSALSVALYGMFLAIIVEPSKKDKAVLLCVIAGFLLSSLFTYLPVLKEIGYGLRVVILTVLIAAVAAILKPVKDEE